MAMTSWRPQQKKLPTRGEGWWLRYHTKPIKKKKTEKKIKFSAPLLIPRDHHSKFWNGFHKLSVCLINSMIRVRERPLGISAAAEETMFSNLRIIVFKHQNSIHNSDGLHLTPFFLLHI